MWSQYPFEYVSMDTTFHLCWMPQMFAASVQSMYDFHLDKIVIASNWVCGRTGPGRPKKGEKPVWPEFMKPWKSEHREVRCAAVHDDTRYLRGELAVDDSLLAKKSNQAYYNGYYGILKMYETMKAMNVVVTPVEQGFYKSNPHSPTTMMPFVVLLTKK